ncbi:hypothetical protein Q8W71_00835 [Methylobacterium sp. NEAU 140]|uniref:hypothetical protein n=1 Tax=Methylobacterium sp. NEAU 140 TaxID=3064945 RepID=UPI00273254D1|nr:hypothetical protein [Methylobacterium sp. NEAU 140]MDP4021154.1 hypothetical protein [Methylobacterium sp. NEAU 140]
MKTMTLAAMLIALGTAAPAFADDQGNANAEQQTQPTPSRGNTSGGPAHDTRPGDAATARSEGHAGHDAGHRKDGSSAGASSR